MTPMDWLLGGDTGISSKTIFAVMNGAKYSDSFGPDVPSDPSDFGRCYRLLKLFPEYRARLPEVAERHKTWGPLVEAWDELTALYEEESKRPDGMARKLYARMKVLIDEGRIAAGWVQKSPSSWSYRQDQK